jgi:hypothetical protein
VGVISGEHFVLFWFSCCDSEVASLFASRRGASATAAALASREHGVLGGGACAHAGRDRVSSPVAAPSLPPALPGSTMGQGPKILREPSDVRSGHPLLVPSRELQVREATGGDFVLPCRFAVVLASGALAGVGGGGGRMNRRRLCTFPFLLG